MEVDSSDDFILCVRAKGRQLLQDIFLREDKTLNGMIFCTVLQTLIIFVVEICTCINNLLIHIHCCIFDLYINTISTLIRLNIPGMFTVIGVLSAWLSFYRALSISLILWCLSLEDHLQNTLPIFLMAFSALPASTDGRDLKLFFHGKYLLQFISFSLSYFPICKYNVHVHDLINCDVFQFVNGCVRIQWTDIQNWQRCVWGWSFCS